MGENIHVQNLRRQKGHSLPLGQEVESLLGPSLSVWAFFPLELGNTISSLFGGGTTPDAKENGTDVIQVRLGAWREGSCSYPDCLGFDSPMLPFSPHQVNHSFLMLLCTRALSPFPFSPDALVCPPRPTLTISLQLSSVCPMNGDPL